jgi:DNA-binding CsgD family transcriptional regulator
MSITSPDADEGIERREMALLARLPVRRGRIAEAGAGRTDDPVVTPRQRQVLDGLVRGLTNKEIAAELGVGPDAVKRTISRLLIKLNVQSRTALVEVALRTSAARLGRARGPNALSLLDAAPIPALVTRGEKHLVEYANPTARSVLEIADIGMSLLDVLSSDARRDFGTTVDDCFRCSQPGVARSVPLRRGTSQDSAWRSADAFITPVHDGADQLAGLIVFLVDTSGPARASTTT